MKKLLFSALVVAVAAGALFVSAQSEKPNSSSLLFENTEALADIEEGLGTARWWVDHFGSANIKCTNGGPQACPISW